MPPPSGAKFKISSTPSSQRGYDATGGGSISCQLEASPALDVESCVYTPFALTKNAPTITGGTASPPTAAVTISTPAATLPVAGAAYAFVLRCQTNGGEAVLVNGRRDYTVNTYERIVVIRNAVGLRKIILGETLEYDPVHGWTQAINELVDAVNGTLQAAGGGNLRIGYPNGIPGALYVANADGSGAAFKIDNGGGLITSAWQIVAPSYQTSNGNVFGNFLHLAEIAPGSIAAPGTGFNLYVDNVDHKLKAVGSSGTVTELGLP